MARVIKYPSNCYYCGKKCEVEKDTNKRAFLQRVKGKWFAHCRDCYQKKKKGEK